MYPGGYIGLIKKMTSEVKRLKEKYIEKNPKHWTIADAKDNRLFIEKGI
jgi:hypothetical protein